MNRRYEIEWDMRNHIFIEGNEDVGKTYALRRLWEVVNKYQLYLIRVMPCSFDLNVFDEGHRRYEGTFSRDRTKKLLRLLKSYDPNSYTSKDLDFFKKEIHHLYDVNCDFYKSINYWHPISIYDRSPLTTGFALLNALKPISPFYKLEGYEDLRDFVKIECDKFIDIFNDLRAIDDDRDWIHPSATIIELINRKSEPQYCDEGILRSTKVAHVRITQKNFLNMVDVLELSVKNLDKSVAICNFLDNIAGLDVEFYE